MDVSQGQPLFGQAPPPLLKGFNIQSESFVPGKKTVQAPAFTPAPAPAPTPAPAPVQVTPAPAPKVVEDPVVKAVEKAGIRATEEDIKNIKELVARLKTAKGEERINALKQVKSIACITNKQPAEQSFWSGQLNRESNLIKLEKSSFTKGGAQQPRHDGQKGGYGRGRGGYNQYNSAPVEGSQDFLKGVSKPYDNRREREPPAEDDFFKRQEADLLRKKLIEESRKTIEKAKGDKNILQKIRLIVNLILPDNFDKKFEELRGYTFGDLKTPNEAGYDKDLHPTLTDENLSEENLQIVVETIFRKAQNEKQYCVFYGELCEKIIKLELSLRGLATTKKNIRSSLFRKTLLTNCRASFDQFFT
jgi:hypothetical protein